MGKRIIITEEEKRCILGKYQLNEGILSKAEAKNGYLIVNNRYSYRLETDNFMEIDIPIKSFDLDSGEYELDTPVGLKNGFIKNQELMNYLSSNLSDGKTPISFSVKLDNKEKNLKFVKND